MNEAHPFFLLAIDDDRQTLELIHSALDDDGTEVLIAESAEAGLRLFEKRHPRVVLMDLRLPGVNGFELLERILALDPGVEVFLITGHYSYESAVEAIQKGASDYLTKPLDIFKLRTRVGAL